MNYKIIIFSLSVLLLCFCIYSCDDTAQENQNPQTTTSPYAGNWTFSFDNLKCKGTTYGASGVDVDINGNFGFIASQGMLTGTVSDVGSVSWTYSCLFLPSCNTSVVGTCTSLNFCSGTYYQDCMGDTLNWSMERN